MNGSMAQALILIINTFGGLFVFLVLIRFLLQLAGADFYNPISQAIVRITSPPLAPIRRIIPGYRRLDFSPLVLALLVNALATFLMFLVAGLNLPDIGTLISWAFIGLLAFILDIYFFALLISVIASWVAPYSGNPALILVHQLMEPVQSIFRKIIPPLGGLDLSPIFIFLGIHILQIMLVQPFASGLRLPTNLVIGI